MGEKTRPPIATQIGLLTIGLLIPILILAIGSKTLDPLNASFVGFLALGTGLFLYQKLIDRYASGFFGRWDQTSAWVSNIWILFGLFCVYSVWGQANEGSRAAIGGGMIALGGLMHFWRMKSDMKVGSDERSGKN